MKNLWSLFLCRLKHSLSIRITLIILVSLSFLASFLTCVINWIVMAHSSQPVLTEWSSTMWTALSGLSFDIGGCGTSMLGFVWVAIIGSFLSVEFRAGLLSQQIAGGYTRKQIYTVHYFGGLLVAGLMYVAWVIGTTLGFLPSGVGWGSADAGRFMATVAVALVNLILVYTFIHFTVYLFKGHSAAGSVPIFIILGLCLFYGLLVGLIPLIVMQLNPNVSGDGLLWFTRIVALVLPVGHVGGAYNSISVASSQTQESLAFFPWHVTLSILIDIGYGCLLFFAGRAHFEKVDLK